MFIKHACRHRLAVVAFLVMVAATSIPVFVGDAWGSTNRKQLAKLLLKRDPGKRVGGETLVAVNTGAVLRGVPGRVNFMMALGSHEVLIGGNSHDELGAYVGTRGVRIDGGGGPDLIHGMGLDEQLFGGPGNDLIYGGPGNTTIDGGPGNDRIIALQGATTVVTGPGRDLVDVRDRQPNDRVICPSGGQAQVLADRGDRLSPGCHRMSAAAVSMFNGLVARASAAQAVTGDGSNGNPYTTDCAPSFGTICVESDFASRSLTGLWANEYVPSYQCPNDLSGGEPGRTFLLDQNYAPGGTTLPDGVYVSGLGPIGVSITQVNSGFNANNPDPAVVNWAGVTVTGFGASSATNWTLGTNSYTVQLHCTWESSQGYNDSSLGPK